MIMADLTLGGAGVPANWGIPSRLFNFATGKYESGGLVWFGRTPATPADKAAAKKYFGANVVFDTRSLVGMNAPNYSTFHAVNAGKGVYQQAAAVVGGKLRVGTAANPPGGKKQQKKKK
jgi:hypothetical protein